jgi:DNA-binding transcriptional regulator YhcF (GntR family)
MSGSLLREAVCANSQLFAILNNHYNRGVRRAATGIVPLLSVDRRSAVPLYRQIYGGFRAAVLERRLRPGQRIPSTRALASELKVSRLPVLEAFEQLVAEGYFLSRTGSGTVVASMPAPGRRDPPRRSIPPRGPRRVSRDADFLFPGAIPGSAVGAPFV